MKYSFFTCLFLMILVSSCLKRSVVPPDSDKVPKADFVEVQLKSGEKYLLKKVKLYEDYLEGDYRGETLRINFQDVESVEIINRDYAKVFAYYVVGGAAMIGILFFVYDNLLFD